MKRIIKGEMPSTGPVELFIDKVLQNWGNRWCITQYHNEYRLIIDRWIATRRLGKGLCVTISHTDAIYIITKLNLIKEQSSVFRNAATYRTAVSEVEMMRIEVFNYKNKGAK